MRRCREPSLDDQQSDKLRPMRSHRRGIDVSLDELIYPGEVRRLVLRSELDWLFTAIASSGELDKVVAIGAVFKGQSSPVDEVPPIETSLEEDDDDPYSERVIPFGKRVVPVEEIELLVENVGTSPAKYSGVLQRSTFDAKGGTPHIVEEPKRAGDTWT